MRRILIVAATIFALCFGLVGTASAAQPQPKLTPKQQQALCIAKQSVALLKAIDKQTWKDKAARQAAIKAIPAKTKAACPLPGTTPPPDPATDVCENVEGIQTTIPEGLFRLRFHPTWCGPPYTRTSSLDIPPGETSEGPLDQVRTDCNGDNNDELVDYVLTGDTSIVTSVTTDDQTVRVNYNNTTGHTVTLTLTANCLGN